MAARMSSWRDAALREMGLGPIWHLRGRESECPLVAEPIPSVAAEDLGTERVAPPAPSTMAEVPVRASAPQTHGPARVPPRVPAIAGGQAPAPAPATTEATAPTVAGRGERVARISALDWDALESDIRGCKACVLCERRKQAVPGVGDRQASWMLVGEGPGAEEDQRGEPFVGQAGRLLDNMLAAIGLARGKDVYIANAVKCRPPHNRTPERGEVAACLPYLDRQIELVQPRLLIALGRPAAQALLDRELAISAARGKRFERHGIPVVVTYHPAYLLRNPQDKAKAWEDLCFARRLMAETPH